MFGRFSMSSLTAVVMAAATATVQAQATCGATGAAPSCSPAGVQVTTTVQRIVFLSITPASFTLTAPTNADFVASGTTTKVDLGAHVATVRANAAWTLTIQGAAWTGTGNNAKAVADLEYTKNGGTSYTTTTTSAVSLTTGAASGGTTVTVGYRTTWTLATDSPGTYTMPLTYTLSSP
ncbi:MAG TPA: hypothetical protein VHE78_08405 [Gemmatimonadaceae bacterium]|nr:hypothetical protein [Gemmatimonadaceae bacterium]